MRCAACQAELVVKDVFPGGTLVCACGEENRVPSTPLRAQIAATPYRQAGDDGASAEAAVVEARMIQCPFCGAPCQPDARACPHCDVQLASVRCAHCFALHFTGSRFCARCGKELELEPLLDPEDAPCPRCDRPLSVMSASSGGGELPMHECTACGGMFVSQGVLDSIVRRESPGPPSPTHPRTATPSPVQHPVDVVRYVKCPLCHALMNRVNFGKRSGVIVDVCKTHGVWFDRGELTQAIEFVAKGGLEAARSSAIPSRDPRQDEALRKEAAELQVALIQDGARDARALGRIEGRWQARHHTTLLDILFELLR